MWFEEVFFGCFRGVSRWKWLENKFSTQKTLTLIFLATIMVVGIWDFNSACNTLFITFFKKIKNKIHPPLQKGKKMYGLSTGPTSIPSV